MNTAPVDDGLAQIESRHALAEALAHYQPAYYKTNGLTVYLYGDDQGRDNLGIYDPSMLTTSIGISQLLTSLNPIIPATGDEQYQIESITRTTVDEAGSLGTEIQFRQVINGLPVGKKNSLLVKLLLGGWSMGGMSGRGSCRLVGLDRVVDEHDNSNQLLFSGTSSFRRSP